jgi:ABC-2 type transport system permease protein
MAAINTYQKRSLQSVLIAILLVLAVNYGATKKFFRWDLTKEKRYTLTPSTKAILKNIDEPIRIEVYLEGKDLPVGIKKLRNSTRELLNEFRALSNGYIDYRFFDINEIDNKEERELLEESLIKGGLFPTNLEVKSKSGTSQKLIFPGALFSTENRSVAVQILENQLSFQTQDVLNNSYNFLEYKLANTVRKLLQERQLRIAFLEGNGEAGTERIADWGQSLALQKFVVQRINLNNNSLLSAENAPDLLIIPKPRQPFSEQHKFEIDQFIMNGGKVMWLLDRAVADLDSFRIAPQYTSVAIDLNLEDQLFKYGVRVNQDLVQDYYCNPIPVTEIEGAGQTKTNLYPWVFHPVVTANNDHPIGKNMDPVALEFASSLDTIRAPNVEKTILLSTSELSRKSGVPLGLDLGIARIEPLPEYFTEPFIPLGVLLEGEFSSLFANRLSAEQNNLLLSKNMPFKEKSVATRQIVISDGDIGVNDMDVNGTPSPLGYYKFTRQTFGNKDFLNNCVEYLLDENGLITARNKETKMQLLDKQRVLEQQGLWQVLNVGLPLAFMFLVGGMIRWRRKKQYVKN